MRDGDEKWWWQGANNFKLHGLVNIKLIRPEPPWVMLHRNQQNFPNTEFHIVIKFFIYRIDRSILTQTNFFLALIFPPYFRIGVLSVARVGLRTLAWPWPPPWAIIILVSD